MGRDPELATHVPQPDVPGLPDLTREPALYGFHATLKPPMRLQTSYAEFLADAQALAAALRPFELPPLQVSDISGFLALREVEACAGLQTLADACVRDLDGHRAPPTEAELARRRAGSRLSPRQDAMLSRWGYPHVLETWFFHMTLTRRLSPDERDVVAPAAQAHFAGALQRPRRVEGITLFVQPAPAAPFLVAERLPFAT